jgi:hypothetical protein
LLGQAMGTPHLPREKHCRAALRLRGAPEKTQKEVAEMLGHLTVIYIASGKAHYQTPAQGK